MVNLSVGRFSILSVDAGSDCCAMGVWVGVLLRSFVWMCVWLFSLLTCSSIIRCGTAYKNKCTLRRPRVHFAKGERSVVWHTRDPIARPGWEHECRRPKQLVRSACQGGQQTQPRRNSCERAGTWRAGVRTDGRTNKRTDGQRDG